MTLKEQSQQDVARYSLPYLMWQWRYADGSNDWQDCNKTLSFKADKEYRRKESATLQFDLAAAKAGDIVQILKNGELFDLPTAPISFEKTKKTGISNPIKISYVIMGKVKFEIHSSDNLRMKHPRRLGVDYEN